MSWAAFGMGALGRLVGNLSDTYGTGDTKEEKDRKDAESDYLARERQGIQARVEGAKAAGLHPLVAMNYQGGNSPSQIIGGGGDVIPQGDFREDPKSDPNIDRYNAARARLAEAEASKAEMELANSRRALANQPGNPPPAVMPTSPANLSGTGSLRPGIKLKPDEVTAGSGGVTAGRHPGGTDVDVPGYGKMRVPAGPLKEALEDNEVAATAMLIALNRSRWWQYLSDDVPWALGLKGAMQGPQSRIKFGSGRLKYRKSSPRREGGASGSW